ncbi:atrial natriuretic peptide receptor 2-like [Paramacrobiotus metropolitanus]|uniref:atrial natriuretic peptide receptor 2-like n=1 Tax=Paramacrobiotus metropolitanus TaxID=2943436 RepID=UPI0024462953|nr:atrial natriuretic peptide receptor 2-like [Paramacrobiotus metropolitanus]
MKALNEIRWRVPPDQLIPIVGKELRVMIYVTYSQMVWVTRLRTTYISVSSAAPLPLTKSMLRAIKNMHELENLNLCRFIGFTIIEKSINLISEHCLRGSIADLMSKLTVDVDLQTAFMLDILRGLRAIHRSPLKYHGHLTIHCCLIDKHFTAKIGRTGYQHMERLLTASGPRDNESRQDEYCIVHGNDPKNDIYAMARVLLYITTREDSLKTPAELRKWRAEQWNVVPKKFGSLFAAMESCLHHSANERPSVNRLIASLNEAIDRVDGGNLMERLIHRLGNYTDELDRQVATRTLQLLDERRRCDVVLREMLPSTVIEELRGGTTPKAEMFDSATLMFTEIGGFLNVLAVSDPKDVLLFLNDVYIAFDRVVDLFDVYKVETIKDSYLVVSGIPIRNGTHHAQEICDLATSLLRAFSAFQTLFIYTAFRAGVHSGRCAAGVVGHKVPRYCLFGDTINTASRILMYGEDSRVHLSSTAAELIVSASAYQVEDRGMIEVKGKGLMRTFWLIVTP